MRETRPYPTIEKDGSFLEVNWDGHDYYIRTSLPNPGDLDLTKHPLNNTVTGFDSFRPKQETFKMFSSGFKVNQQQIVTAYYYVSEDFLRDEDNRAEKIDEYVKRYAPWIFSYGNRSRMP